MWDEGGFPPRFKAKVVAWYNVHRLIEMHSSDAVNRKQEADMKRKGR